MIRFQMLDPLDHCLFALTGSQGSSHVITDRQMTMPQARSVHSHPSRKSCCAWQKRTLQNWKLCAEHTTRTVFVLLYAHAYGPWPFVVGYDIDRNHGIAEVALSMICGR